jgi:hypothetical protein
VEPRNEVAVVCDGCVQLSGIDELLHYDPRTFINEPPADGISLVEHRA